MIIHLNGWPGVGKLTIARHIADRLNGRLLDNHTIYNLAFSLADFRSPEFYALVSSVRDAAFQRVAEISPTVPVIMTNAFGRSEWAQENWRIIRELANRRGSPFFAVTITCSDEEHLRRIASEGRKPLGKLTDRRELPAVLGPLMEDGAEHLLRLDTTDITPQQSAAMICDWVQEVLSSPERTSAVPCNTR